MATYKQRIRGADLFQRVMNSNAHSAILCIYTQIEAARMRGVARGMQDCISLCTTTMNIRSNAELRENKHFKLTAPILEHTIAAL
jgi:hypothetical protein